MEIRDILKNMACAFSCFKQAYRPGMTCGALFEAFAASLQKSMPGYRIQYDFLCGADTVGVDGVTESGYVPQPGDTIILDASVCQGGPWCDVARTFFVGAYTAEQAEAYEWVRKSIKAGEATLRAGAAAGDVYDAVNAVYAAAGRTLIHHAGHRIGKKPLLPPQFLAGECGTILTDRFYTIESGLYQPCGIRLENDYYIGKNGAENLFEDLMPLRIEDYILS